MKKPEELFLDEKPGIQYHLILSVIHQLPKDTDKKFTNKLPEI
jgi:hypothetical protein